MLWLMTTPVALPAGKKGLLVREQQGGDPKS
jgi:hypothetical protein